MSRNLVKSLLLPLLIVSLFACNRERKVSPAFYFWKSSFRNNSTEQQALKDLGAKKLYIKFFDVQWDNNMQRPFPSAKINFDSTVLKQLKTSGTELVPVVFITNETLQNIIPESIKTLGERINFLMSGLLNDNLITQCKEIQVDCDWTESTKDKYFDLLRYLKMLPLFIDKQLSVTIRLYQCKYLDKTGVPPASRGMLMCYNMGNLQSPKTGNSILEVTELKKYIGSLESYPLPLDLALPLFEWNVLFRNNEYKGLLTGLDDSTLTRDGLSMQNDNRFTLTKDTLLQGYDLKKGDEIRKEKTNYNELVEAAKALSPKWQTPEFCVSFYHLDSATLSKYKINELESIIRIMHP